MVQSAKEQALLIFAFSKENINSFKTTWIDVKKAFNYIDHIYLIKYIESLKLLMWITDFLKNTITRWKVGVRFNGESVIEKSL